MLQDQDRYQKVLKTFWRISTQRQVQSEFFRSTLLDILANIGNGKSQLNIIGVGSGDGKVDVEMLSQLRLKHPGLLLENEVVEPSAQRIHKFREMVADMSDLDPVKFIWNQMTDSEFEEQWRQREIKKKADFIHLLHVLYFVEDAGATISFFQSLLEKNGKLLINIVSGFQATKQVKVWGKVWAVRGMRERFPGQLVVVRTVRAAVKPHFCRPPRPVFIVNSAPSFFKQFNPLADIFSAETFGRRDWRDLLDFVTHTMFFSKTASPDLKQRILRRLRDPQCSVEKDGRILQNINQEMIILEALS
ncbi:hypothetical protein WMY93_018037 [Mugilogobius chulae]|uniref:Histamine N-methyltransferase n=1 Tax=Mugilogobius chulae TaxID=88201 RepID=A0AAW0NKF6_9GOBI